MRWPGRVQMEPSVPVAPSVVADPFQRSRSMQNRGLKQSRSTARRSLIIEWKRSHSWSGRAVQAMRTALRGRRRDVGHQARWAPFATVI
jgi:hypothetical protein